MIYTLTVTSINMSLNTRQAYLYVNAYIPHIKRLVVVNTDSNRVDVSKK